MNTQAMASTAEAPERRGTQVDIYAAQVMGDEERAGAMLRALPSHVPAQRFQRNLVNLLMQKPEMLKYDPRMVYREVSKAAALGLYLDPQLGEGYIVPVWNGKKGCTEPQLRIGYRGIMKLGRQSGDIASLYPGEVRERDHFLADEGTEKRLEHQPDYTKPRGEPVCYYAVVIYKDGTKDFEVMDIESIRQIRDRSDAWKAFTAKKISSTPWFTDEGEMSKKTVLKRLCKRVPQSPDLADAITLDNEDHTGASIELTAQPVPRQAPKSIASRLDQFADAGEGEGEQFDRETGEILEQNAAAGVLAPAAQEGAAPSTGNTIPDADGAAPDKLKDASDRGRAARASGMERALPKNLAGKANAAAAEAFLAAWDKQDDLETGGR